jgi:hypothetical protein
MPKPGRGLSRTTIRHRGTAVPLSPSEGDFTKEERLMPEFIETPFADLHIPCSHDGRTVLVPLPPLCEAMKLDTWTELGRLGNDLDLRDLIKTVPFRPGAAAMQALPVGGLTLWFERLAQRHDDVALRHRLAILQQEGFASLLDHWATLSAKSQSAPDATTLKRQFRRLQSQISGLSDALQHGATAIEQEILRAQLSELCQFPIMPRATTSPLSEKFWNAVFARLVNGADLNHARRSDRLLALNFRHLASVLDDGKEPIALTRELRTELKKSRQPYFLGVRVVNSRIAHKSLRCWVFNLH